MDLRSAHSLYQALQGDRCAFGYSGSFPDEHTARLIDIGAAVLESQGSSIVERGRLGYVMVEAYQNIVRHAATLPAPLERGGRSLFLLRCKERGQQVVTMNAVTRAQGEKLQVELAALDGKSSSQLKELFLTGLQRASNTSARGAGLGMIEMTRRSGHAAKWSLRKLTEDLNLFLLGLHLGKETGTEHLLPEASGLHDITSGAGLRFFHFGVRPPGAEEALLRLLETEIGPESRQRSAYARALLAAMGLLDSPTSGKDQQLLAFCETGGRHSLLIGGPMEEHEAAQLEEQVQELASWDGMRMQRGYREAVLRRGTSSIPLGLIELARISPQPVAFAMHPHQRGALVLVSAAL